MFSGPMTVLKKTRNAKMQENSYFPNGRKSWHVASRSSQLYLPGLVLISLISNCRLRSMVNCKGSQAIQASNQMYGVYLTMWQALIISCNNYSDDKTVSPLSVLTRINKSILDV